MCLELINETESFSTLSYRDNMIFTFKCITNSLDYSALHIDKTLSADCWDILSDCLYMEERKNDLKMLALYCISTSPYRGQTCYVLGNLFSLLRKHELAITWFNRCLIIDPNCISALILLGNEYLESRKLRQAIDAYVTALGIL